MGDILMPVLATAMVDMPMVATPMPTTERGPLMPSPRLRLMPTTLEVTVLAMAMVDFMVDMDTEPMVPIPMPTTERGPLMPSPRLMPTMPLMDMVSPMLDTAMPVLPMVMVPTPTPMVPMPTASKMCNQSQIRVAHQVQTEAQKQTKSRSNLTFSA